VPIVIFTRVSVGNLALKQAYNSTGRFNCFLLIFILCSGIIISPNCEAQQLAKQRADFVSVEAALKRGDHSMYVRRVDSLESYPLFPYLQYLNLKSNLSDVRRIEAYLKEYQSIRYAKLLRRRYLAYLAGTGQWGRFVKNYEESTRSKQQCLYNWALYQSGQRDKALKGAVDLWLVGKSQPDECNQLFGALKTSSYFASDMTWRRFQLALQNGQLGLAKYLSRQLSRADQSAAGRAIGLHQKPNQVAQCAIWKTANSHEAWPIIHGIDRLARTDPLLAQQLWNIRGATLKADQSEKERLEKRLAMALVYRHHPNAFNSMQKIGSRADETLRAWRVRAGLVNQDWRQVKQAFDELDENQRLEVKWQYWLARSLEAQGKSAEAAVIYKKLAAERDFYGFLAADRQNMDYSFSDHVIVPQADDMAKLENWPAFRMVKEFLYFDRLAEARQQWWHALDQLDTAQKRTAAKIAEKWGLVQTAIFTVAKAKDWDDLALRFPILYRNPIDRYAKLHNMPPQMVYGVIRQESVFDHQIVSSAGARGLMQIMPATGRQIARQFKERWRSSNILFEPERNIKYGVSYLSGLLKRFEHNFALAAGGYNAGPHRVDRWLNGRGALDTDIWVETIPFKETRRYVRRVLAYALIYQHRLGYDTRRISTLTPKIKNVNRTSSRRDSLPFVKQCL